MYEGLAAARPGVGGLFVGVAAAPVLVGCGAALWLAREVRGRASGSS